MTKRNEKLLELIQKLEDERIILANLRSDKETTLVKLDILTKKAEALEAAQVTSICTETNSDGSLKYPSDRTRTCAVTNELARSAVFTRTIKRVNRIRRKLICYDKELQILDSKIKSKETIIAIQKI